MRKVNFRTAIKAAGFTIKKWNNGYNYRSAFAEKDGQLYYFFSGDLRMNHPLFMYRKAKDMKDYTGGANLNFQDVCHALDLRIVEPLKRCDFNSF